MNECESFQGAFISQNGLKSARQILVEDQGVISGRPNVESRSADGRPGTIFAFWMACKDHLVFDIML